MAVSSIRESRRIFDLVSRAARLEDDLRDPTGVVYLLLPAVVAREQLGHGLMLWPRAEGSRASAAKATRPDSAACLGPIRGVGCGPCVITARTLCSTWENAHGPGAGAVIAVLQGLCAERSSPMEIGDPIRVIEVEPA